DKKRWRSAACRFPAERRGALFVEVAPAFEDFQNVVVIADAERFRLAGAADADLRRRRRPGLLVREAPAIFEEQRLDVPRRTVVVTQPLAERDDVAFGLQVRELARLVGRHEVALPRLGR